MTDTQNFSLPPEKPEISSNYKIDGCKLAATSIRFYAYMRMSISTLKDVRIITNLNT